jgi:hypothetical protein
MEQSPLLASIARIEAIFAAIAPPTTPFATAHPKEIAKKTARVQIPNLRSAAFSVAFA